MTEISARPAPGGSRAAVPRYSGNRGAVEQWAEFPSGVSVPVVRGRVRAYPGLKSAAPATAPFYRAFASVGSGDGRVLDVGAGSGIGSALLAPHYDHVVAVDADPKALAFVREYAPEVETVQSHFHEPIGGPAADAAVIADVLGIVKDPVVLLGSLRGSLGARARVLVAEPSAFVAQRLVTPARRAFSHRSLEALLVRSGFHATTWVADTGTFIACVATAADDGSWEHFAVARREGAADPDLALSALAVAQRSGRRDVQREAAIAVGELRLALSDGDGAARAFLDAASLDANDPRPLAGLSLLALLGGSLGDAMELAARAAELDPTEARAATALAWAADRAGHPDTFNVWRITERLLPDDLDVTSRLAALASERGDYAFGISVFERLRSYGDPLPAQFYVTLALMLAAEGRRSDALLELRLARALEPDNEMVLELWSELGFLRVLTFNCHEGYIHLLGKLGVELDIIDGLPGRYTARWDQRMRPVPAGARLIGMRDVTERPRYDAVIAHNVLDLLDARHVNAPKILVLHVNLRARAAEEPGAPPPEEMSRQVAQYLSLIGGIAVAVSTAKRDSWRLDCDVIRPAVDPVDWTGYHGSEPSLLRVANQVGIRRARFAWDAQEHVVRGLPLRLVGHNPDIPGCTASRGWDDLRETYRAHRAYVHTADPALEDGYNLALLEAMATGMPAISTVAPESPVIDGENGFTGGDVVALNEGARALLDDVDLAKRMGARARESVLDGFGVDAFVKGWRAAFARARDAFQVVHGVRFAANR